MIKNDPKKTKTTKTKKTPMNKAQKRSTMKTQLNKAQNKPTNNPQKPNKQATKIQDNKTSMNKPQKSPTKKTAKQKNINKQSQKSNPNKRREPIEIDLKAIKAKNADPKKQTLLKVFAHGAIKDNILKVSSVINEITNQVYTFRDEKNNPRMIVVELDPDDIVCQY